MLLQYSSNKELCLLCLLKSSLRPSDLTLVNKDDVSFVYLCLCEIRDALLRRLFQRHHTIGRHLKEVNQFLCRGVGIFGGQHVGGDVSFLSSEDLENTKRERHIKSTRLSNVCRGVI